MKPFIKQGDGNCTFAGCEIDDRVVRDGSVAVYYFDGLEHIEHELLGEAEWWNALRAESTVSG